MKWVFGILVGALVASAVAQPGAADRQQVIKDPAEYVNYMLALNTSDPEHRAALLEKFAVQYPQSVVRADALEKAMDGYRLASNADALERVAKAIVGTQPNHSRALTFLAIIKRRQAANEQDASDAQSFAERALTHISDSAQPDGFGPEMRPALEGVIGFGLLQKKDYARALDHYRRSDQSDLENAFQLAICELELNPNDSNGLRHLVNAMQLAETRTNDLAAKQIAAYGRAKYIAYHGTASGWDELVKATRVETGASPATPGASR
jgi:hypothetical protein